jgi:hypothetical protein
MAECEPVRIRIVLHHRTCAVSIRLQEIPVDAAPTSLAHFTVPHDAFGQHPARRELFYGLSNGDIGQLFLDDRTCHHGTVLENMNGRGAVTALFSAFDMSADGMDEIAVGRDDGSFEVYNMDNCGRLQLVQHWFTVFSVRARELSIQPLGSPVHKPLSCYES